MHFINLFYFIFTNNHTSNQLMIQRIVFISDYKQVVVVIVGNFIKEVPSGKLKTSNNQCHELVVENNINVCKFFGPLS